MKNTIKYIAYLLDKAKKNNEPKAIIFLGAGASATAGIPLTHVIVRHIKLKYKDNPVIKSMIANKVDDYYKIMQALTSDERKDLFYYYITRKKVKINVTNIYLAQLLNEGYVDYILTVNFDDLILRACGLFNFLPPVYDISNVKLPTTSNYREKSVIYMHGQHYGQWLLNNKEELDKVKEDVSNLFNEIKTKRTWIVVGYSGQDEIFNQITNLGCFSNELFWISYFNEDPLENVISELLEKQNTNAYLVKGYNSDSFFLNLNSELGIDTPDIFNKPFTFLKDIIENIKDISEHEKRREQKELYKNIKERMDISNRWIDKAIKQIQEEDTVDKFKQDIIDAYTKGEFENNESIFSTKIKKEGFDEANKELSTFYSSWASEIADLARLNEDTDLYKLSFEKYKESVDLDSSYWGTYNNWGVALKELGELTSDKRKYNEGIKMYNKAIELNEYSEIIYNNLGNSYVGLAVLNSDMELFFQGFEKFNKAIELNPKYWETYDNWVSGLLNYIHSNKNLNEEEVEDILSDAKEKALKVYSNSEDSYNLSCVFSMMRDKENAFKYLKEALNKGFIDKKHVLEDRDWEFYLEDQDFIELLNDIK